MPITLEVLDRMKRNKEEAEVKKAEAVFEARRTRAYEIAAELNKTMRCNCDLDRWVPERLTGHSWVCRIHKAATIQLAQETPHRVY